MPVAKSQDAKREISKKKACEKAFMKLKQTSYTIVITDPSVTSIQDFLISQDELSAAGEQNLSIPTLAKEAFTGSKVIPQSSAPQKSDKVESGFAFKMMKKMGWTGSGLGAQEQGITEPIE